MKKALSPRTRHNIGRILPFGFIWLLSGWVFLAIEHAAVDNIGSLPDTAIRLNWQVFLFASTMVFSLGLLIGYLEVVHLERLFASKSFAQKILLKVMMYSGLLFIVIFLVFPVAASIELQTHLLAPRVWQKYLNFLGSITFFSTALQLTVSLLLSFFYAEISETVGYRSLINFFTGRYHRPTEEERIFMFLDLKSSTTIAEKLGHVAYFNLLKEYYADISAAIVDYEGEIYQYAGDEVIVSWRSREGLRNHNCLRCFFAMEQALEQKRPRYEQRFGLLPTFKAGLHLGTVTTGEIGVIKREIFFTGDVLNVAARIQGLCNSYGVKLLLSAALAEQLPGNKGHRIRPVGESELRGKSQRLRLFTVDKAVHKSVAEKAE